MKTSTKAVLALAVLVLAISGCNKPEATPAQETPVAVTAPVVDAVPEATPDSMPAAMVSAEAAPSVNVPVWSKEYAQGVFEYTAKAGQYEIYIACTTSDATLDEKSSITISKNGVNLSKYAIVINGDSSNAPFSAESNVGEDIFLFTLNTFRNGGEFTIVDNGVKTTFTGGNGRSIIPDTKGKEFFCRTENMNNN